MIFSRSENKLIALIVAGAFFMQHLDSSIIATSLPQMALSFHVCALDLSLGITIYLLSAAAFVPLSGWLANRHGARNVFLLAIAVFTFASLVCGVATSLWQFVMARAIQGIGGALMAPVGRMVVLRNTTKENLLHATALITWPALAAPVIGPALGGFITTYISWRWNFFLNMPLGVIGMILALKFIPNVRDDEPRDLDWQGFFLSAAALVALLYGMESFAHLHNAWQQPLLITAMGAMLAVWCVHHLHQVNHPLVDLASLRVPTYAISTIHSGFFIRAVISATPFLLPLLFQLGFGLSAWASGTLVLVYFLGNFGIKPATTPALKRFGFRTVLIVNGIAVAASLMALGFFSNTSPRWLLMVVLLFAGVVRSLQFTCLNTLAFADVADTQRGSAATLSSMLNQVSSVTGVALGALLLSVAQHFNPDAGNNSGAELFDFRVAFVITGLIALVAALAFARLPRDAGTAVSGHRANR